MPAVAPGVDVGDAVDVAREDADGLGVALAQRAAVPHLADAVVGAGGQDVRVRVHERDRVHVVVVGVDLRGGEEREMNVLLYLIGMENILCSNIAQLRPGRIALETRLKYETPVLKGSDWRSIKKVSVSNPKEFLKTQFE